MKFSENATKGDSTMSKKQEYTDLVKRIEQSGDERPNQGEMAEAYHLYKGVTKEERERVAKALLYSIRCGYRVEVLLATCLLTFKELYKSKIFSPLPPTFDRAPTILAKSSIFIS